MSENGEFAITIPLQQADFFTISHENKKLELFLSPTDSLHLDFTSKELITGTSAAINNHLDSLRTRINSYRRFINGKDFYNQSLENATALLDSLETSYVKMHQDFKTRVDVPERFERKVLADFHFRNKLYQTVFPAVYKQRTKKDLGISKDYFEILAQGSFDNPDYLKSVDFILFLESYLEVQSSGDYKYDVYFDAPVEKIHTKYREIQKLRAHQEIKDYLFYQHLDKTIDNYGVGYLNDLIADFKSDCKNSKYREKILERYTAGMERRKEPSEIKIYKTVGDVELEAHIFYPDNYNPSDKRPAYVFFHGGGWAIGIPEWGYKNCKKYSELGMVAISFEYRLLDIHGSQIQDGVRDAKSAIAWTRAEAATLGIDPNKIVAAGFSAGGHLAACTAILDSYEDEAKQGFSAKPNAIIVHSASYNTLKNSWFNRRSGNQAESFSTFHQLDKKLVPSIFFHGTEDHLAPIAEFTEFKDKMDALGNVYEHEIFEGVGHFFNNAAASKKVGVLTEDFLRRNGYLE